MAMPTLKDTDSVRASRVMGGSDGLAHLVGHLDGVLLAADIRQEQDEFVTPHAPEGVGVAQRPGNPLGDLPQDPIADGVAVVVVDAL
jgi:hypothetical protein